MGCLYFLALGSRVAHLELLISEQLLRSLSAAVVLRLCQSEQCWACCRSYCRSYWGKHCHSHLDFAACALQGCPRGSLGSSELLLPVLLCRAPLLSKSLAVPGHLKSVMCCLQDTAPSCPAAQLASVAAGADGHHHNLPNLVLFYQHAVLPRDPKTTRAMLTKVHCIHRQISVLQTESYSSIHQHVLSHYLEVSKYAPILLSYWFNCIQWRVQNLVLSTLTVELHTTGVFFILTPWIYLHIVVGIFLQCCITTFST